MNLRSSFKKRSSHSPSLIGRASNWTYTRLRITRTLKWAEDEIFNVFPRTAQPIQVRSSSTNIRSLYSLPQLAEHLIKHTHDWELREYWIGPRVRFYTFSLTAQPIQVRNSFTNIRPFFKKRPSHSSSSIGRASNWTYTRLRITMMIMILQIKKYDSELFH